MRTNGTVLLATETFAAVETRPERALVEAGFELRRNRHNRRLGRADYPEMLRDVDYVMAGLEPYDREVFQGYPRLKVISRIGIGVDAIDVKAASACGVAVYNTPAAPSRSVAELTMGFILCLLRGIPRMNTDLHSGCWRPYQGLDLASRTIGLVGCGRIGRLVAAMLGSFGSRVLVCDPIVDETAARRLGVELVGLEELLRSSDLVSLHVPLYEGTRHLINGARLDLMQPTAFLVNTSRGGIVDDAELIRRLNSNRLAGAALDVFEVEPITTPYAGVQKLLVSPHIGSNTVEGRFRMEMGAVQNLLDYVKALELGQPIPQGPIL
jgi:D-3-phosphoglycerate dehydrogenase